MQLRMEVILSLGVYRVSSCFVAEIRVQFDYWYSCPYYSRSLCSLYISNLVGGGLIIACPFAFRKITTSMSLRMKKITIESNVPMCHVDGSDGSDADSEYPDAHVLHVLCFL